VHYTQSGPRVIRLQNIGDAEFINEKAHIAEEHFNQLMRHSVEAGDVIIAALGSPAPRACLVPDWLGKAIVKADCVRLRPNHGYLESGYLMYALNSDSIQSMTEKIVHGIGRPRLNLGEIKSIPLPIPPKIEQKKILQEIEHTLSMIRKIEELLETNFERAERLRQSILKRAFSGKLVPQDPNDEPAAVLLERIRLQKEKGKGSGKGDKIE
jgi:type I restriction enzyme S subunit